MRKLATVRRISAVDPIPSADNLEVATIDGWKVVVKKGEFRPGQLALYLEIDSWVPHELAPFLSRGQAPKVYDGVLGQRLRTIKLRGQLSQGLAFPLGSPENTSFPQIWRYAQERGLDEHGLFSVDFSELLGIKKWEPSIPAVLSGQVKGPFPSWIHKTEQERCQNLVDEIFADPNAAYEVTMKLDGTSMTAYVRDGEIGVCSRNLELKINEKNENNAIVRALRESGLDKALKELGGNFAVQGELMGPGIQGNREKLRAHELYVFDIFDIDAGRYLPPINRLNVFSALHYLTGGKVRHVPIIDPAVRLRDVATDLAELLKYAEGPSIVNATREGVVFKRLDGQFSFKVISNAFLLSKQ